jgi:DnaJ-domain-containing protein 1
MRSLFIIVICALYILVPFDVLPDLFGLFGRIDDLLFALLALYLLKGGQIPRWNRSFEGSTSTSHDNKPTRSVAPSSDPYDLLEVDPSASADEIHRAYRKLIVQYHPDKVAHLGEDLRKVAHQKSIEIQAAYEQLASKNRSS